MLKTTITKTVPFYDVDAIQMVWHGSYVKYLEDGREAFGRQYGLEYMRIFDNGYYAPVVDMHLQYRKTAAIGDVLTIDTFYVPTNSAKLVFRYEIRREPDGELILEAETTQLFVSRSGEFEPSTPLFVEQWREKISSL